jgi:hypothetical protein
MRLSSRLFRQRTVECIETGANATLLGDRGDGTMTELEKIAVTAAVTIAVGVIVYVIGQVLSKIFIEPAYELKKTIGEVRFNLAFHASVIHTPVARNTERSEKAYEALMKSSCDLLARVNSIPFYGFLSKTTGRFLPPKKAIVDAAVQLRGLSTYVHETDAKANKSLETIEKRVARIEKNLGLEPLN